MKFALVNGERETALPTVTGECVGCGTQMVPKCGKIRIHHWAHKGHRLCDPWWENETSWHREWKDKFPAHWQEVVHTASDGERHIADVKTKDGWVIEFQHSYLRPEERRSRCAFYSKLIWIVDGTRRKRDVTQFLNSVNHGLAIGAARRISSSGCALIRDWSENTAPLFFDFGAGALWWLAGRADDGAAWIAPYSRTDFINGRLGVNPQLTRDFDAFVRDVPGLIATWESAARIQYRYR